MHLDHRQIAATRNAGAREAIGEMRIFVDADTVVIPVAFRAAVTAMRAGAAGGGCAFRFDGRLPLYGRVLQAIVVPLHRVVGLARACFLFCTREAFEAAGGFDERLFGAEEAALSHAFRRQGPFVVLRESVLTSKPQAAGPLGAGGTRSSRPARAYGPKSLAATKRVGLMVRRAAKRRRVESLCSSH